jgi:hypothetical protein
MKAKLIQSVSTRERKMMRPPECLRETNQCTTACQRTTGGLFNCSARSVGLPPAEEWEGEMLATVLWENRSLAVPLARLQVLNVDTITAQAWRIGTAGLRKATSFNSPFSR